MRRCTLPCLIFLFSLISSLAAQTGVIQTIAVPPNSQDASCTVNTDNAPLITVPPYPFDVQRGVGYLVNPAAPSFITNFVLHDHVYVAPNVPDPARATVHYEFDVPVTVAGVYVMQHSNGITRIEGFAGNSAATLTSVGSVFGPLGDITGFNVLSDFLIQAFNFTTPQPGTIFDLIIRKTSHTNGWANFRIVPFDLTGAPIPTAQYGLDSCAAGTIGSVNPSFTTPLRINGQSGGQTFRVDVPVNAPFNVSMLQLPFNPLPSRYIIVGITDVPDATDAFVAPGAVGTLCMNTLYNSPMTPGLFVLANSFSPDPFALLPSTTAPWNSPSFSLPFPFQFAVQGVIEVSPGILRTTNAVLANIF